MIEELIGLAKDMQSAHTRGETFGLTEDELAFSDALETNDSAVKVLGEPTLTKIARERAEDGEEERHDRLDGARKRASAAPSPGKTHVEEVRLSA